MRSSVKRFPITLIISTIMVISLIYLQESELVPKSREILTKVNLVLGLGIPLSLCIKLLIENFLREKKSVSYLVQLLGAGFLVLYYFIFLTDYEVLAMSRYSVVMMVLILLFLYIPRLKNYNNYEYYIMDIYYSLSLTFTYSLVLYLGIVAILLTIDGLFDINIKGELYYYIFLIVALIFGVSLFTSKIPKVDQEFKNIEYPNALKILILYIVIPLISIYTFILYIYFGKILVTMEWPRGLVSHLVVWYSTVSVGVIFLITPILGENKLAKAFKIWFPKIILPVLLMMFISIWQRINQYGITENRYYLIVLGLWVTGIMLYFSFQRPLRNIIIPISLSIVMVNSVFGPLSSFAISKSSQNKRLEKILNINNMIGEDGIIPNSKVSSEDKKEINNIITYFNTNHKLQDIKLLPKDTSLYNIASITGFEYESYYSNLVDEGGYFNYSINSVEEIIDIKGYDYFLNINSWDENKKSLHGLILEYDKNKNILIISENDNVLWEQDIKGFIEDIHEKQKGISSSNKGGYDIEHEHMTYEAERADDNLNKMKLKFIFRNIYGKINNNGEITIDNIDFTLLIKR